MVVNGTTGQWLGEPRWNATFAKNHVKTKKAASLGRLSPVLCYQDALSAAVGHQLRQSRYSVAAYGAGGSSVRGIAMA